MDSGYISKHVHDKNCKELVLKMLLQLSEYKDISTFDILGATVRIMTDTDNYALGGKCFKSVFGIGENIDSGDKSNSTKILRGLLMKAKKEVNNSGDF